MPFFDQIGPLVFGHRGAGKLAPENTIAAFDAGMAAGVDGLELDVRLTSDGVVVVHHDETLERTTNGSGPIAARTAAELRAFDAGRGERIPTLRDVLARYPDTRLIIEMKVDTAAMAQAVVSEVQRAGAVQRVCVGGFGKRSLAAARTLLPAMASSASSVEVRMAVYRGWLGWPASRVPYGGFQIPERAEGIHVASPRFVRQAHQRGLKVQVWTVDAEADVQRLLGIGVDGIISDRPDVTVPARNAIVSAS